MQSTLTLPSTQQAIRRRRGPARLPPRVLLVDDCPLQRLLGLALLSRWRVIPELAGSGKEAILLAAEQDFDIILMDLDMPLVHGFAATQAIREHERSGKRRKRVPVVAYTANDAASSEHGWSDSGMDAVLAKPSRPADMGACLRRWCPHTLLVDSAAGSAQACFE